MKRILQRFPLIWVVVMFAVLIAAWTTLITLAVRNAPEQIVVEKPVRTSH
jgi:hypothetical protein